MLQQGQVFELATRGRDGKRVWAYRYRAGGRTRSACSAAASAVRRTRARRWSAFWRGSGARVGWREGRPSPTSSTNFSRTTSIATTPSGSSRSAPIGSNAVRRRSPCRSCARGRADRHRVDNDLSLDTSGHAGFRERVALDEASLRLLGRTYSGRDELIASRSEFRAAKLTRPIAIAIARADCHAGPREARRPCPRRPSRAGS